MTVPGVSCKALATPNSSEWPCSMCPILRLVGVRTSYIYFSNISWTPWVLDPITNPFLGPSSWLHPASIIIKKKRLGVSRGSVSSTREVSVTTDSSVFWMWCWLHESTHVLKWQDYTHTLEQCKSLGFDIGTVVMWHVTNGEARWGVCRISLYYLYNFLWIYSYFNITFFFLKKINEPLLTHAPTWMNLKIIMLNEGN